MIAAVAALTLPLTATPAAAVADPIESPELTENSLHTTGPLPRTKCAEKRVKRGDRKLARAYFNGVIACLDKTWGNHLEKAGLAFDKVRVKHYNRIPRKYCGFDITKEPSQVWYCDDNQTIAVQLGKDWLKYPDDLWLFQTAASMYGYHVQNVVGIADAYTELPYDDRSEMLEQARRSSLQTECLGAAFLKSVWPLKGRSSRDYRELLKITKGDTRGAERWYGKTANVHAWIKRGFATGDPKSCNTWTASSSKVA